MPAWWKGWLLSLAVLAILSAAFLSDVVGSILGALLAIVFFGSIGYATYQGVRDRRATAARQRVDEHPQF